MRQHEVPGPHAARIVESIKYWPDGTLPTIGEEAHAQLNGICVEIFEEQLDGCCRNPSVRLVRQDSVAFIRWFEYCFHSLPIDL